MWYERRTVNYWSWHIADSASVYDTWYDISTDVIQLRHSLHWLKSYQVSHLVNHADENEMNAELNDQKKIMTEQSQQNIFHFQQQRQVNNGVIACDFAPQLSMARINCSHLPSATACVPLMPSALSTLKWLQMKRVTPNAPTIGQAVCTDHLIVPDNGCSYGSLTRCF